MLLSQYKKRTSIFVIWSYTYKRSNTQQPGGKEASLGTSNHYPIELPRPFLSRKKYFEIYSISFDNDDKLMMMKQRKATPQVTSIATKIMPTSSWLSIMPLLLQGLVLVVVGMTMTRAENQQLNCSQYTTYDPHNLPGTYAFRLETLIPLTSHICGHDGNTFDCCVTDPYLRTCVLMEDGQAAYDCYPPFGSDGIMEEDPCREANTYDPNNGPGTYSSTRVSLREHACSRDGTISDCCVTDPVLGTCVLMLEGYGPAYDCYISPEVIHYPTTGGVIQQHDYPNCHGYITGKDRFIPNEPPKPIPCGQIYGDNGFPSFQDVSCCSGEGRYFVQSRQIGGFDASYSDVVTNKCLGFSSAMAMVLCDPRQGDFVTNNNILRICRSSCDLLFGICGPPGESYPGWASYYDGTSLCYEMFGGFGSTACEDREDGYVCQTGLAIEVVDTDCLDMIIPDYDFDEGGPDACAIIEDDEISDIAAVFIFLAFVLVSCCCCVLCCFLVWSHCGGKKQDLRTTHPQVETPAKLEPSMIQRTPFNIEEPPTPIKVDDEALSEEPTTSRRAAGWKSQQVSPEHIEVAVDEEIEIVDGHMEANKHSNPPSINPSHIRNNANTPAKLTTQVPLPIAEPTSYNIVEPPMHPQFASLSEVVANADSQNQVQVAKEWMQDHPVAAEGLTPNQIAEVISKVTFSLNQATVAETIAVGMGNGLTCEHVVAAMEKCSLQKEDVAKCMAPYVQDPQNKDIVLAEITFPYERKQISKRFRNYQ